MKTLRILTAAAMVLGLGIAVFPSTAAAATTVTTEAQLRAAFADPEETKITLGASIHLGCDDDLGQPDLVRDSAKALTVHGDGHTIVQTCLWRIMTVKGGGALTVDDVTLGGGHIAGQSGGAIYADGDVAVIDSRLTHNTAGAGAGAVFASGNVAVRASTLSDNQAAGAGGAIFADGDVKVTGSTLSGNRAEEGSGGAIYAGSEAAVTNSTLTGNRSGDSGGAIAAGIARLTNTTVTGNSAAELGGGIAASRDVALTYTTVVANDAPSGANIWVINARLVSYGSVVAMPVGEGRKNCTFGPEGWVESSTHNFSDDTSCDFMDGTDTQNGGDPKLGELADNGGRNHTRMPEQGSPLIDAIPTASCDSELITDQRGASRPKGDGCDIGAVERDGGGSSPADPPKVSVTDVRVTEGNTGTTAATFLVTLDKASDQVVQMQKSTADGTATAPDDYAFQGGTVVFNPGETSAAVTVDVAGDLVPEDDEYFFLRLSGAENAEIVDGEGEGVIIDDDDVAPSPQLSVYDKAVTEGTSGTTPESVLVSLDRPAETEVTVNFASKDGTAVSPDDYSSVSGELLFSPGQMSREIAVEVVGDTVAEDDETFSIELSDASGADIADGSGVVTIIDDDDENPPPPENQTPTAQDVDAEATQGRPVTVSVEASDPDGDELRYSLVTLPGNGAVSGDGATYTYASDSGYTGDDTFTVKVCDPQNACDEAVATIDVKAFAPPEQPPADAGTLAVDPSTVKAGEAVSVSGTGFEAHEAVFLVLHSTPQRLSTVPADSDGKVAATITIPDGTQLGAHQIVAYGEKQSLAGDLTVTAAKKPDDEKPGHKQPGDDGSGGNGGHTPGTSGTDDGKKLALTGAAGIPLLIGLGTALLLTGAVWLLVARRVRRRL